MDFVQYLIVGVYLLFLASIGIVFKRLNSNESDYFRSGCHGNWWMVGMSLFMSSISAQTFVANSGVAYRAGFSILTIYFISIIGYLVLALGVAAWYRQTRVTTFAEIVRERFGPAFQQFFSYYSMFFMLAWAGLGLFQLALFAHTAFDFPITLVIVALGGIVLFYTLTGGNWAVLAGDFLQSLVLLPMIFLLAGLSLWRVGGISGFFEAISESAELSKDFAIIDNTREDGLYSWQWLIGITTMQVYAVLGMNGGHRFFSCKDGREARKSALFCMVIFSLAATVYFIPPMVARVLYDAEVMALDTPNPQDIAYAFMSDKLLPFGFLPLMVVAMFSAQMSSLDTGLNANSALFMMNAYPALMRLCGKKPSENPKVLLLLGRIFTLIFGSLVILAAIHFSRRVGEQGVFELTFRVSGIIGIPMLMPLFFGFFIRRTPWWSGWLCICVTLIPSIYGFMIGMPTYHIAIINSVVGIICFSLTSLFWNKSSQQSRDAIVALFAKIKTPVNIKEELGEYDDCLIFKFMGSLALFLGSMIWFFLLFPNSFYQRLSILCVALFVQSVGVILLLVYKSKSKKVSLD